MRTDTLPRYAFVLCALCEECMESMKLEYDPICLYKGYLAWRRCTNCRSNDGKMVRYTARSGRDLI